MITQTVQNRTNLDVVLSVLLVIGLLFTGIKLVTGNGKATKLLGGVVLALLAADIIGTSNYWSGLLNKATGYETQLLTSVEAWKNVQG